MKHLLCAIAAIALLVPAGASAQQNDRPHPNRADQQQNRTSHQQSRPARGRNRTSHERPTIQPVQPGRPNRPNRPDHGRPAIQPVPHRPGRPNHGRPTIQPVPHRPVYQPGRRPSSYHRIRGPIFHYPRGYGYRRWGIGAILPHIFLSNYYYWTDWRALGLLPPPPGYVWVRYGPDLLLVNRYTGRIADVIYGAFY
jgi:Ni/Co efflux regulator RcnB